MSQIRESASLQREGRRRPDSSAQASDKFFCVNYVG